MDIPPEKLPRRLRRLPRVWADDDGTISYLLTLCIKGRKLVLANGPTYFRFTAFLLESPARSDWFPRRFVLMPDHLHVIAHAGAEADTLGEWIKAMKAVVGGLASPVGPVPSPGVPALVPAVRKSMRLPRSWQWQSGYHDYKFRDGRSEQRKWEYVCMNPVRYGLVKRPEEWPYAGEIFYEDPAGPRLIRGAPPLLDKAILMKKEETPGKDAEQGKMK